LHPLVDSVVVSPFQTNCYIVGCPETKEGIIIDPGDEPERILAVVNSHQLKIVAIVATHGHLDHVLAVKAVKEATGAPFLLPEPDLPIARSAHIQARFYNWLAEPVPDPDGFLEEGQTLSVGNLSFQVLELPGHTPGHIALFGRTKKVKGAYFRVMSCLPEASVAPICPEAIGRFCRTR
jgi:glyoxylase-like metal-dependent hydrolase (beta-lactamase superfamily II)